MRGFRSVLLIRHGAFPRVEPTAFITLAQVAHNFVSVPILLEVLDPCRR